MELRDPETHALIGAAMTVHSILGHGFSEAVYHEAMTLELASLSVPHASEVLLPVFYKEHALVTHYRADLICYASVVVELKALSEIGGKEEAQLLNYLKATGFSRGLLLNFGTERLQFKRMVWNYQR
jgi:GxxExxY protein